MPRPAVLIFAKHPDPGAVKTRMTPPLTPQQAADLHAACLRVVVDNVCALTNVTLRLLVTPDDQTADTATLVNVPLAHAFPQGEGHLGHRMHRAAQAACTDDFDKVVFLGADSPTLPPDYITRAIEHLDHTDAVLGPSEDGGYYLLGLRAAYPGLFEGIDWGTPAVADQTRESARRGGLTLAELPVWYDLDRFEDLPRARADLTRTDQHKTASAELMALLTNMLKGKTR